MDEFGTMDLSCMEQEASVNGPILSQIMIILPR